MNPVDLLLDAARREELHHTIILHGPDAATLRRVALRVARALNCENRTSGDDCATCVRIERGIHPDVELVTVAEQRKLIAIEQVRALVSDSTLRPFESRHKVFIIDPADAISIAGANALLKTLEEPGGKSMFLLLTVSADRLLPTIRSRAQSVAIRPVAELPARQRAEQLSVPLQSARLRDIASGESDEIDRAAEDLVEAIAALAVRRELAPLLAAAARLASFDDPVVAVMLSTAVLRDLTALDAVDTIDAEKTNAIREEIGAERLLEAAGRLLRGGTRLGVNIDTRLMFEGALLTLARKTR